MKRWNVLGLSLFVALLTLGSPLPGLATPDIDDSFNDAKNAANDDSFIISDIQVAVASSILGGQVTGNSIIAQSSADLDTRTGSNCIAEGTFTSTGISVVSQNTGIMNHTQQSINVQANLTQ